MTQARAPNWEEIRKEFETTDIKLSQLAKKYDLNYDTLKSRKKREGWEKGAPKNKKGAPETAEKVHLKGRKRGAPLGNRNAKGNIGGGAPVGNKNAQGHGAPLGNKNAETHGFFSRIFPEEVLPVALDIMTKDPVDMLWENIIIQYTAIARAQKLMFVRDQDDTTKELKKQKAQYDIVSGGKDQPDETVPIYLEEEYEIQFAWDKQATFLNAQSRAMTTLAGLTEKFMLLAGKDDKRRLELEKMMQSIEVEREKLVLAKEKLELERNKANPKAENEQVIFVDDIKGEDGGEES
ncbi:phage terminase small subunit [Aneurinibacillus thermoaerophilus]|uniref:phage terminase small subunit n=1 Tax=Aneurinibacillus thermoaerophilus TaxID=143495 RepID=UPI002E216292|nr:phage terminase small subunit [Aneurinibacillus thermoaerophilus]